MERTQFAAPEHTSEEQWASRLTHCMEALEEIRSLLVRPQGLSSAQEESVVESYRRIENEASELEAYGRQQRWI